MTPSAEFDDVRLQQKRTAAARELVVSSDLHVMSAIDTAGLTAAAALSRALGTADLRAIGDAIAAAAAAYNATRESAELRPLLAAYLPLRELHRALTDAIDERAAVLDRASPALARIRRSLSQAQVDARDRVASILRSANYAKAIQDPIVTIREGRFVVPVKAEFSGAVPGIVHDTSSSGQTLFVEPLAALESNNRVRTLRIEEEREVQRILEALSRDVGERAQQIEANVTMLAAIDVLVAKANVARSMDGVEPMLSDEPELTLDRGRHPLLGERAVPQSLTLDAATRIVVISGPNMGGKSVALKMAGLFVAMAYCGMQLPAGSSTRIGRFDEVLADIGDDQSIAANTSTFSAHLARMRELLRRAGARTLALIDEIGGGTEPGAGAALAIAMLERLLDAGAAAIVTTHATELKLFAHASRRVANASVRFDPETFVPTFALDTGAPGQSLAFPLARSIGIAEPIVDRAQRLLDTRERDYESALAELSQRNAELARAREELERERSAAQRERDGLQRDRDAFDAERRAFGERAEGVMQQRLREFAAELARRAEANRSARPKVTASQAGLMASALAQMRGELGIRPEERAAPDGQSFRPDDRVRVVSLAQDGTVVEDYGETVLVAIGVMKTVVPKSDLQRRGRSPADKKRAPAIAAAPRLEAATRSQAELDVRGKRFAEAEPLVERWIDEAVLAGSGTVRLIHGKGTGMLGRGLQEYLRTHPSVKALRYGNENEGAGGVTIVELRD